MNSEVANLKKKLGDRWPIFEKLHKVILSASPDIKFRIFPIYVSYYLEDDNIAIVYVGGKFTSADQLDAGFNFKEKPKKLSFVNATHMKYPGITYSIKLNSPNDI